MSRFVHSPILEVEGKRPFSFIPSHLATKTSHACFLSTPAGPLSGTYRPSSARLSRHFVTPRTQRPTTSTKVLALAWSATSAHLRRGRRLKPCLARLPSSLRRAANGQTQRPARSSRNAFALAAEKADGHARRTRHAQGGAQAGHRAGRRRWHQYLDRSPDPLARQLASQEGAATCEDRCLLRRQRDRSLRSG